MTSERLLPGIAPDGSDDVDIKPVLLKLAHFNPEFRVPKSERAQNLIDAILLDENGKPLTGHEVKQNKEEAMIKIGSIIEQLRQNPLWMKLLEKADEKEAESDGKFLSRVACTEEEFEEETPRTVYKTLQEPLTPKEFRLNVPNGYSRGKETDMSVVTIGLDNINNKLLENLGLHQLVPPPRTRQKDRLAAYRSALPQIKTALARLEPIALPHETDENEIHFFRLMRFASGPNEGLILGSQHIAGKKRFFQTGLYRGFRRIDCHIRENYSLEIKSLIGEIKNTILEIDREITAEWEKIKGTPELAEIQNKLLEIEGQLAYVQDEHKVEIRRLIGRCASFKTVRRIPARFGITPDGIRIQKSEERTIEALNPCAMRPMWHRAMREIGERISKIAHIEGRLQEDTARLNAMIQEQEAPFVKFYDDVMAGHEMYKIMRGEVNAKNAPAICKNLRVLKSKFAADESGPSPIKYQPYLTIAARLTGHIDSIISLLEKKPIDAEAAAAEFVKIFVVVKVERFYHDLQMIYGDHLAPVRVPFFVPLRDSIIEATGTLNRDRINPSKDVSPKRVATPEYDEVYRRMHALMKALLPKARAGIRAMDKKRGKDETLATTLKNEMRELIHNFDIVKILKEESDMRTPKPRMASQIRLDFTKGPGEKSSEEKP